MALTVERHIKRAIVFQAAFKLKSFLHSDFFVPVITIVPARDNNITEPLGTNIPTKKNRDGAADNK